MNDIAEPHSSSLVRDPPFLPARPKAAWMTRAAPVSLDQIGSSSMTTSPDVAAEAEQCVEHLMPVGWARRYRRVCELADEPAIAERLASSLVARRRIVAGLQSVKEERLPAVAAGNDAERGSRPSSATNRDSAATPRPGRTCRWLNERHRSLSIVRILFISIVLLSMS